MTENKFNKIGNSRFLLKRKKFSLPLKTKFKAFFARKSAGISAHKRILKPGILPRFFIKSKIKLSRYFSIFISNAKSSRITRALSVPMSKAKSGLGSLLSKISLCLVFALFFICRAAKIGILSLKRLFLLILKKAREFSAFLVEQAKDIFYLAMRNRGAAALTICTFLLVICGFCFFDVGLEVFIDGQDVGKINNQQNFEQLLLSVEAHAADYLNHPYVLSSDIQYKFSFFRNSKYVDDSRIRQLLFSKIDDITIAAVLRVDEKLVAACDKREQLESILSQILSEYEKQNENASVKFVEDISITEEPISTEYLIEPDDIKRLLTEKTAETASYIVQKGDTLSGLALKFGTGVDAMRAINPGISPDKLQIGQVLETSRAVSMLSVQETAQITYNQDIAYEKTVKKNDAMYTNERKVIQTGKNGVRQITADVSYVDGVEISRTIVGEKIISQPTTQIEYVGTKKPPAKSATGTFIRPFGGYISSNYGYRGREFHTGVDFAGPTGSAIVASDGGKVTFSGWNGGYGKCIIIRHSSGLETLYGHCSSLLVKTGESVAKGQQIAKVGSTGRSTGPHVHFEVRVNGKHTSPWKYIK